MLRQPIGALGVAVERPPLEGATRVRAMAEKAETGVT